MPYYCSVYGCKSVQGRGSESLAFHRFPKDKEERKKWAKALRRKFWEPTDASRICSVHFEESDYKEGVGKRVLQPGMIPSIFPSFPAHLQPKKKKRRVLVKPSSPVDIGELTDLRSSKLSDNNIHLQHHNYCHSNDMDVLRKHCDYLTQTVEKMECKIKSLEHKVKWRDAKLVKLNNIIEDLQHKKILSDETMCSLERYKDVELDLVKKLVEPKSKTVKFSEEVIKFAQTLHFYSPKGYDFVRQTFNLPSPSTLRKQLSTLKCMPGFNKEAFRELTSHKAFDEDATLMADNMS